VVFINVLFQSTFDKVEEENKSCPLPSMDKERAVEQLPSEFDQLMV
jgi:hypothetical protein